MKSVHELSLAIHQKFYIDPTPFWPLYENATLVRVSHFLCWKWFETDLTKWYYLTFQAFLGRPTAERNASFGATKFVELDTLNSMEYIKDDTIFIKVVVDSDEMVCLWVGLNKNTLALQGNKRHRYLHDILAIYYGSSVR